MGWRTNKAAAPLPDWLRARPEKLHYPLESKALQITQYENIFPGILERICTGYTLASAVRECPIEIEAGAFSLWVKKNPERNALYKEAKEVCAEIWAGRLVNIAEGVTEDGEASIDDLSRSKFKFDVYKWLIERYNRKDFGDTKTFDITTTISIKGALEEARQRVEQIIDVDIEELQPSPALLALSEATREEMDDADVEDNEDPEGC